MGPWDVAVSDNNEAFSKQSVVAYVSLLQPVLKSDVVEVHGEMDVEALQAIRIAAARLLDLRSIA